MFKGQKIICYADFETQEINDKAQVIEWVILYSHFKGVMSNYENPDKVAIIHNKKYKFIAHVGIDIQDFIKTIEEFLNVNLWSTLTILEDLIVIIF